LTTVIVMIIKKKLKVFISYSKQVIQARLFNRPNTVFLKVRISFQVKAQASNLKKVKKQ